MASDRGHSATPLKRQKWLTPGSLPTAFGHQVQLTVIIVSDLRFAGMSGWTVTRMESAGRPVFKLVENDRFGQFPFVYAIEAWDKFIIIDTGTGQHSLRACVAQLNTKHLPYLILLTHCHFDHIGGVTQFVNEPGPSRHVSPHTFYLTC
jgi:glyoxylase-like metal-dependent hydrolase (beta-lactamase superfamily II)